MRNKLNKINENKTEGMNEMNKITKLINDENLDVTEYKNEEVFTKGMGTEKWDYALKHGFLTEDVKSNPVLQKYFPQSSIIEGDNGNSISKNLSCSNKQYKEIKRACRRGRTYETGSMDFGSVTKTYLIKKVGHNDYRTECGKKVFNSNMMNEVTNAGKDMLTNSNTTSGSMMKDLLNDGKTFDEAINTIDELSDRVSYPSSYLGEEN